MNQEFLQVLHAHRLRYPLMQPQDYGKLAYQSEFGPEHLLTEENVFLSGLLAEWEALSPNRPSIPPESIGNGLCRFHLWGTCAKRQAAGLLFRLCRLTASEHKGSPEGLRARLAYLPSLPPKDMDKWLRAYQAQDCPPVHHSQIFQRTYDPHYRLLKREYAFYFPLLLQIWELKTNSKPMIIAIDGRCGSGKTQLAELIQKILPCNVFHMDDFYLPFEKRRPDWRSIPAGNMDLKRFQKEILAPAKRGEKITLRAYRCREGAFSPPLTPPKRNLILIEGSYAHHPALADQYDLRIFLSCSKTLQEKRLKLRQGKGFENFAKTWIPLEEQYFSAFHIEKKADIHFDTSGFFQEDQVPD